MTVVDDDMEVADDEALLFQSALSGTHASQTDSTGARNQNTESHHSGDRQQAPLNTTDATTPATL